jgi:hypothetical protein
MADNAIAGTWRMTSWTTRAIEDGHIVTRPLGDAPNGYITYTDDGRMSVTAMASGRPPLGGGILVYESSFSSPERKAGALDTYLSYCGAYSVQDNCVTHHIEVSWWPDLCGTDIPRFFAVEGDRLELSSPPFTQAGVEQRHVLEWERA